MKIDSSVVALQSHSKATKKYSLKETLHTWVGEKENTTSNNVNNSNKLNTNELNKNRSKNFHGFRLKTQLDKFLILLLELLTGKKITFKDIKEFFDEERNIDKISKPQETSHKRTVKKSYKLNYIYKLEETYTETQQVTLKAQGVVHTEDGRTINFNLDLFLNRNFIESRGIQISNGEFSEQGGTSSQLQTARPVVDPLVINFNNNAASLSKQTMSFDLNSDGTNEDIAMLNAGSGFLSFDKNGDGVINDGSELFGPQSGNGFTELAKYDIDGNSWIDENDAVYDKLSVWTVSSSGENKLTSLKDMDVGAIFLGNVAANFTYKDAENNSIANSKGLGIYLHEDGIAGSIQQLDYYI